MNKGHRGMMFMIFVLFGIFVNLQFRGVILSNTNATPKAKEMASKLIAEREENKRLINQLTSIEAERERLLKNMGTSQNNQEINNLIKIKDYEYFRAGLTPVSGNGVMITLEDALEVGELETKEYIVHDIDLNGILNELKAYGAQAISVNGERIATPTKVICAGPTIIVNESRYPPPYVIKAIGDQDVLFEAIDTMSQVAFMRLMGIRINVAKEDNIVMGRYHFYKPLDVLLNGLEVVVE